MVFQLQALQGTGLQALGIELETVAAQVLGVLHGGVGLADQYRDIPRGIGQQADAYRGADHQLVAIDPQRHTQLVQQAAGDPHQARQVAIGIEQHGKLVAGKPRHRVGLGHGIADALGHLLEQMVGNFMAKAVIEQLEAVQVDVQQRQPAPALTQALTGLMQAQAEQGAVGEARQLVIVGQVTQALLGLAACRQVGKEADDAGQVAAGIAHAVKLQPLWIKLTVLARLDQLTLPAALLLQRQFDGLGMPACIPAARQLQQTALEQFFAVVAGNPAKGLIDRQQHIVRIENHDAFAGRFEYGGGQALLFFLGFLRADIAAGAEHTQHPPAGIALHRPTTVFDPAPVALAVTHPVVDAVILAATLEVFDQGALEQRHVIGMQPWLEVREHFLDLFRLQAEQFTQLGMVDLVGFQVPVPQPQFAGLQGQGQALFALAQRLVGNIELLAALGDARLKSHLRLAQLFLDQPTLLDLPGQCLVKSFAAALRSLQVLDQFLILKAPQQPTLDQPVDLPGHH
ncbi:hypothetical protein D3C79_630690 [compost metagenome]